MHYSVLPRTLDLSTLRVATF